MSWLNRLSQRHPSANALKRANKRDGATAMVGQAVGRLGRRLAGWKADRRNINALMAAGGEDLRARARQMCRENPYASNALEAFVAASVGAGIKPSSMITDGEKKKAVQAAFLVWTDEADADGLTDFYGLQALAARAMFEAGECFIRFIVTPSSDGLSVPLQLQVLEAEHLPLSHNEVLANGNIVRHGIEFDERGKRVAYHFLTAHPGEGAMRWRGLNRTIVPAADVMHLYRPLRPGQVRGQPGITPSMIRLYLLDQYDDAELDRKRTAAMFAGFITKKAPEDADPVSGQQAETAGETAVAPMEPGTMQVLLEGEDVKFSEPTEVGGSYEAFQYRSLCAIGAGCGVPYHLVSGDLSKANYGNLRGGQVEFRRRVDQFQHMTLVFQLCLPVWRRFLEMAVLVGAVPLSPVELRSDPTTRAAKWIPPRWEWVDPAKDRNAELLAVRAGFKPLSDVIEAEGYDVDDVLDDIAAMNLKLDERGIITDSDPRKVSKAGLTQARAAGSELPENVTEPPAQSAA